MGDNVGQQRTVSAPIASTSRLDLPAVKGVDHHASSDEPTRVSFNNDQTNARRSFSQPSPVAATDAPAPAASAFLTEATLSANGALPFETKHGGPASLKRMFLGPHLLSSPTSSPKGKERANDSESHHQEHAEALSNSQRSGTSNVLRRATTRERNVSGNTMASDTPVQRRRQRKASVSRWAGQSFEIGGDVRAAAARRVQARQMRKASTASTIGAPSTYATAEPSIKIDPPPSDIEQAERREEEADSPVAVKLTEGLKSILKRERDKPNGEALGHGMPPLETMKSRSREDKPLSGDKPPAPVAEVLARKEATFAAPPARVETSLERSTKGVDRKERMLVKCEWTSRVDLPDYLDESISRKFPPTQESPWEEYAVVWRGKHLELWTEYRLPLQSKFLGHKKLKHVIPLVPGRTRLSLYSASDFLFCITYRSSHALEAEQKALEPIADQPKLSKPTRAKTRFRREGTNVYIFRARSSTIAKEWMWSIFYAVKSAESIPKALFVSAPGLGARIRLPVPDELPHARRVTPSSVTRFAIAQDGTDDSGHRFRSLRPNAVVKACFDRLCKVSEFELITSLAKKEGVELRLAWRKGHLLDWVPTGSNAHDWSVISGITMRQGEELPVLELRPALHYPTTVRMPAVDPRDGEIRVSEPEAIEGYVERVKNSGLTERLYLSTHDGHVLVLKPSQAHAPDPPMPVQQSLNNPASLVLTPFLLGFASMGQKKRKRDRIYSMLSGTEKRIKRRGKRSERLFDLDDGSGEEDVDDGDSDDDDDDSDENEDAEHDVAFRAFERKEKKRLHRQLVHARGYFDLRDVVEVRQLVEGSLDEFDAGGQDGLAASSSKDDLRKKRTFVVRLRSGAEIKLETHSISLMREWVGRLSALMAYWKRRERLDAQEQMELSANAEALSGSSSIGSRLNGHLDGMAPLLSKAYNFCIIEGCRSIVRAGRFFVRKGTRGVFQERYFFLVPGLLIEYSVCQRDIHGQPTRAAFHRRKGTMSVRGCYVYTGRLALSRAEQQRSNGASEWDPSHGTARFPRVYTQTDGLETTDDDDECTFVIFKKKEGTLGTSGKVRSFRARSKVERDEWVFALNVAIEQMQKVEWKREEALKEFAWLDES